MYADFRALCLLAGLAVLGHASAQPPSPPPPSRNAIAAPPSSVSDAPISATAEAIYGDAKPRLLQIRTLLNAASQKSSTGSGFLVSEDGLAITNYHVVSQHAMEPQTYRMEYVSADGSRGKLKLLAFDVVNDVALVQLDKGGWSHFEFDPRALAGKLPRGEKLFSLGNPLDIGFAVMEGNYSGLVERSYGERIHLSGPLNPGMSGGPTLDGSSRVAGVNVAKSTSAEQVSFLVPAKYAVALLKRPRLPEALTGKITRAEITRQVTEWQNALFAALESKGFKPTANGPYIVPESATDWFTCGARTNADAKPKPLARADSAGCSMQNWLFLAGDLFAGNVSLSRTHFRTEDLNSFQFAKFISQNAHVRGDEVNPRRFTAPACHEDVFQADSDGKHPKLRVMWCATAYRDLDGLYNTTLLAITQDRSDEAVAVTMALSGVTYANAMRFAKRFLAELQVNP
ncbi:MAG: serine protease [Betaproteobacteria bacterium]